MFVNLYNATPVERNPDFAPEYVQPWVPRFDETSAGAKSNKAGSKKLRAFGLTLLSAASRETREFQMLIQLTPCQLETLRHWFTPERPGPLIGLHVLNTGNGACFVDRWPNPRTLLANAADNYALAGDPETMTADELKLHISGFVEAPERFAPLLRAVFPDLRLWDRVVFELRTKPALLLPAKQLIRRLEPDDVYHLQRMRPELNWIWNTWSGPERLAASGYAWGAFANERLVSVACSFFVGEHYEDIGVVTESEFRGLGLSVACAGKLCEDIQSRGKQPSWTTSPDNLASVRVAEKLGFVLHRHDVLYAIGVSIPEPARRS